MIQILCITLPATLTRRHQAFGLFLGGLWQALPKSMLRRLAGLQEHVALEIHADQRRLLFRFWTPTPAVAQVLSRQARAHFPEIAIETCSGRRPGLWPRSSRGRPGRTFPRSP